MPSHNKIKIFNDPIYGLISFPYPILYDLIEHRYFQRLRRITQTGLTYLVYPGAVHSRYHHALGALHLMTRAIRTLREKGTTISDEEAEAVCIAILLHDIGHGPFSHALEGKILPVHHEALSLAYFKALNQEFDGRLDLAIQIFTDQYERKFLHQLVSSQLDMDRMDYLSRDSFFTGVAEGIIGYDRIITMLRVVDDQIVVEEKAIYSIEKFLIARNIMYWQVYLHKTVLSAEKMLVHFWSHFLKTYGTSQPSLLPPSLFELLKQRQGAADKAISRAELDLFSLIDDTDFYFVLKNCYDDRDFILQYLSKGIVDRRLHKISLSETQPSDEQVAERVATVAHRLDIQKTVAKNLIFTGSEETATYTVTSNEIKFLLRNNQIVDLRKISKLQLPDFQQVKYYLCYPKDWIS